MDHNLSPIIQSQVHEINVFHCIDFSYKLLCVAGVPTSHTNRGTHVNYWCILIAISEFME
jgi:hypothetical protein